MDVVNSIAGTDLPSYLQSSSINPAQINSYIISSNLDARYSGKTDTVSIDFSELYKSLTVSGQKIIDKLNELLKGSVPNGIQSLKPEDVTPEATADRIVTGATGFFDIFSRQHPELSSEELLTQFMQQIKSGIDQGYGEAVGTLKDLGAFEFDGVESGIKQTKELVDQKLKDYEAKMREKLGLNSALTTAQKAAANDAFLGQAGAIVSAAN